MNPFDIITDFLPVLPNVPETGMLYYLQTECLLRGRRHQNTFWLRFVGGEKTVFQFFQDNTLTIMNRILLCQSWDVQMLGYWFVKVFPPPYVIMFVPYPLFGFYTEPACENKQLAIASLYTELRGRKNRGRKFIFGMPASWVTGNQLTPEGVEIINSRFMTFTQLYHPDYEEWPYTWGLMHRYVDGSYHSPLNPLNYAEFRHHVIRTALVKHRHVKRSQRWPF